MGRWLLMQSFHANIVPNQCASSWCTGTYLYMSRPVGAICRKVGATTSGTPDRRVQLRFTATALTSGQKCGPTLCGPLSSAGWLAISHRGACGGTEVNYILRRICVGARGVLLCCLLGIRDDIALTGRLVRGPCCSFKPRGASVASGSTDVSRNRCCMSRS